jgi:magnesium transporter
MATPAKTTSGIHVRRFDADRTDRVLTIEEALAEAPDERQLLWIDVQGTLEPDVAARLADRFALNERTRVALDRPGDRPSLTIHGSYFHVRVAAEPTGAERDRSAWVDIVAGVNNVVISRHSGPVAFFGDLDERMDADSSVGVFTSATFVALLLDGAVTTYFGAVDAIEDEIDDLDARSLLRADQDDQLDDLVTLRRRVSRLRRVLTDHRTVFASLGQTSLAQLVDDEAGASALVAVSKRFDDAIASVEDTRAALIGSFDVFMTRTAQRTNDVMKILAITTVLLLPGSLIAGLLGMNVSIPLSKDDPMAFWYVVVGVVILAVVVVAVARVRRWL